MNSYNTNKNAPLNRRLNQINDELSKHPDKGFINSINSGDNSISNTNNGNNDDNVFRGFSNTQGYKPETKSTDKWGIF